MTDTELCPCTSGRPFADCCGPILAGTAKAATAEALMRSRYAACVVSEADYLFTTWHPRTRPDDVVLDPAREWTGLELLDVVAGGPDDDEGVVEGSDAAAEPDWLKHLEAALDADPRLGIACPKVSKAHVEQLRHMGALDDLPDTSQLTLF